MTGNYNEETRKKGKIEVGDRLKVSPQVRTLPVTLAIFTSERAPIYEIRKPYGVFPHRLQLCYIHDSLFFQNKWAKTARQVPTSLNHNNVRFKTTDQQKKFMPS